MRNDDMSYWSRISEIKNNHCVICYKPTNGVMDEHNPQPIKELEEDGKINRCCSDCNEHFVIPARFTLQGIDKDSRDVEAWSDYISTNISASLPREIPKGELRMMAVRDLIGHSSLKITDDEWRNNNGKA